MAMRDGRQDPSRMAERVENLGHHGLRVLACATKTSLRLPTPRLTKV